MEKRTQKNVLDWAVGSFGRCAIDRQERAARLVEEAIEVAQAMGLDQSLIPKIADRVYEGEPGDLWQELGGCQITLQAAAESVEHELDDCADREWRRVLSKPKHWWAKKHAAKVAAGTADIGASEKGRK